MGLNIVFRNLPVVQDYECKYFFGYPFNNHNLQILEFTDVAMVVMRSLTIYY